jgi:hypothetical protein
VRDQLCGRLDVDLLFRRSRHIVQGRPLPSVCWADIPELSVRIRRCPAAWQQYWQQSLRSRYRSRPSVFQAGHIPSCYGFHERCAPSPVAAGHGWSLLLLSPLLSNLRRPVRSQADPHLAGDGPRPVWAGSRLALVFWPECPQRLRDQA